MKAKIITELQKYHIAEKSFVNITYGSAEHDIFITKIYPNEEIEFVGDNGLKLPIGAEFFIGKANDKKLKMQVI